MVYENVRIITILLWS